MKSCLANGTWDIKLENAFVDSPGNLRNFYIELRENNIANDNTMKLLN